MTGRHLPVGPLLDAMKQAGVGTNELIRRSGIDIARPRRAGRVTEDMADRAAIAIGRHPAEIWDDWAATAG